MKKLALLFILSCSFLNAQYLVEDNDISENTTEGGKLAISYDINNPLEFYRLKCENAVYAQFPGGENAFRQTLLKNMRGYLDTGFYSVNGTFELIINIIKNGNLQRLELKPEVPNSNLLYRDIELALRKMNPKFTPANCNGSPVDSKLRQKINFRTESFDL